MRLRGTDAGRAAGDRLTHPPAELAASEYLDRCSRISIPGQRLGSNGPGRARQDRTEVSARRYSVVWTAVAVKDVERLAAYLRDESPLRAQRVLDRVISRGESLEVFPRRGRTPPELQPIGDQTWLEAQEAPWRIIYRIRAQSRDPRRLRRPTGLAGHSDGTAAPRLIPAGGWHCHAARPRRYDESFIGTVG
jgi:toxin ParE1/3/4